VDLADRLGGERTLRLALLVMLAGALVKQRTSANTLAVGIYTGFAALLLFSGVLALATFSFGMSGQPGLPLVLLLVAPLEGGSLLIQNVFIEPELALAYGVVAAIGGLLSAGLSWGLLHFTIRVLEGSGWAR